MAARVFRRKVFYIPGYDPIHPRRYRELYRKEGAAQAALSGYRLSVSAKAAGAGAYGWQVDAEIEGQACHADVEVLVWSDIVRASMSRGIFATYAQLLRTSWAYIGSGALARLMRLRKGPMIAALYPVAFLLGQLALALALALLLGRALASHLHWGLGLCAGALVLWGVLYGFRAKDNRVFAWYLMHDYAYGAQAGGAYPAALKARLAEFADRIGAALQEDYDEVLLVGHSSGAHLGCSVLADLWRAGRVRAGEGAGPVLSFLSLGQVVPMISFLPRAAGLRRDLHDLAGQGDIAWIDVTAPGDGCAFALCDPVAVSGVSPPGKQWPLVLSAAFRQTLRPETLQAMRWRWFRLHFQYLCAFDNLAGTRGEYDYFRTTAGPLTLAQRYGARRPSNSRIETATSRHRSLA